MSDPMTNTEVEDVLASIRRLVSDDKRPEAHAVQQPPNDRLVLTPSLRVNDEDDPDAPEDGGDLAAPDPEAEQGMQSENTETAFEPSTEMYDDDAPSAHEPEAESTAPPRQPEGPQAGDDDAIMREQDIDAPDPEPAVSPVDEVLVAKEAANAPDTDEVFAEDNPDDVLALQVPEDWEQQEDADTEQDLAGPDAPVEEAADRPLTQSLSEKIAALETLVGNRTDRFEPDDPGTDAYAGTDPPAMAWEDADADEVPVDTAPAAPAAAANEAPRQSEQEAPAQLFSSDEDVLDEDALRELVSDIVREELQGALGERITRNVRKLVRREIHRALAAQDLE